MISNYEICTWLAGQGVSKSLGHNLGGGSQHPFGRVQLTIAHHSSQLPDGSNGGNPSGFLLTLTAEKLRIYFACDTGLFYDMKLIGSAGLDLAVLPIGDLFTMGPDDALSAVNLLHPKHVIPSHFNTWPPIAQDAAGLGRARESRNASGAACAEAGRDMETLKNANRGLQAVARNLAEAVCDVQRANAGDLHVSVMRAQTQCDHKRCGACFRMDAKDADHAQRALPTL